MNNEFDTVEELYNEENIGSLLSKRMGVKDVVEKQFGKDVVVAGYIKRKTDLGKNLKFLTLSDFSDEIQLTLNRDSYSGIDIVDKLTPHTFIVARGEASKGMSRQGREINVKELYSLSNSTAEPLPIEIKDMQTTLDKKLDYRWIVLREDKYRFPLILVSEFAKYGRYFFYDNDFTEIFTPKLMGSPSETGAELFPVVYFDKEAFLAQSPQFYKQMAICSGFDKVFEIGPVFRANPSNTTRHDTEFTSLDFEVGYISSHKDVMSIEEKMLNYIFGNISEKWGEKIRKLFSKEITLPEKIPQIKMEEVYEIVSKGNISLEGDLRPEGEKEIFKYGIETYGNDFIFITDFPYSVRPFYHMKDSPMKNGKETTRSFDLIYRGVEITTGAQREHRYKSLVRQLEEKGLEKSTLNYYLDFFKYGAPPHGGLGLSPTRVVMSMLGLGNVKEATFVPRDQKRLFP